jgi:imidazolonepropionase-like amidohydrolase
MLAVLALGLISVAVAQQPARLVISNVRVFTGARIIDRALITVADGKILSIAATPPVRAGVTIDGTGKTALPGLIDVHVHMLVGITEADTRAFINDALQERLQAFLRYGVTTVKSASDPPDLILGVRQDLRDGTRAGPRLLVVGPSLTARGGHPASTICRGDAWCRANRAAEVDSAEHARREVRRLAERRVDAIKVVYSNGEPEFKSSFPKLSLEIVEAIVDEARSAALPVTVHVTDESMALEVLAAGVSGLEHGPNAPQDTNALARALKSRERSLVPTLATLAARTPPTPSLQSRSRTVTELHKAGVRIVVGTDTRLDMPPGLSTVRELELLVKAGLSTEAALVAATSAAAQHLGLEKEIGTLETGMSADILLVRGDPTRNIGDLHQVEAVVQRGRIVFRPGP